MRKLILAVLALLLFLPLTIHGSSAYFTDSESIGVNISSAESSPFYDLWLTSDGASYRPGSSEKVSSGAGESYTVDFGNCTRQSIAKQGFDLGTVFNKTSTEFHKLRFSFSDGSGIVQKLELVSSNDKLPAGDNSVFYIQFKNNPPRGEYTFSVTLVAEIKGSTENTSHTFYFRINIVD